MAADFGDYCEIQASYAIGVVEPTSIFINEFESEKVSASDLAQLVLSNFDLTPSGIIAELDLLQPNYFNPSSYGHFGREDQNFTWEEVKKL